MGMNLTLLVVEGASESRGFSHTILSMSRDRKFWHSIRNAFERRTFELSSYVSTNESGENCYGHVKDTPYGEPITYIEIERLVEIMSDCIEHLSQNNRAILAYLRECPYDLVALYWH